MKKKIIAAACLAGLSLSAVNGHTVLADTNKDLLEDMQINDYYSYTDDSDPSGAIANNQNQDHNYTIVSTGISRDHFEELDEIDNIKINGRLPQITNSTDDKFEERINTMIKEYYREVINAHEEMAFAIDFDVYQYSNLVSVVINFKEVEKDGTNETTAEEDAKHFTRSIVFDRIVLEEKTLRDLLGDEYKTIIQEQLENMTDEDQQDRNESMANSNDTDVIADKNDINNINDTSDTDIVKNTAENDKNTDSAVKDEETDDTFISASQSFYVDNGVIYVIFDSHTATAAGGTHVVKIPFDNALSVKLGQSDYFTEENQDFVPISTVLKLGMDVRLNNDRTMEIFADGRVVADLHLEENHYSLIGGGYNSLSSEPKLHKGYIVSVPLDFFHSSLGATVTKDNRNQIMIESAIR